jgi:hypothetical protein
VVSMDSNPSGSKRSHTSDISGGNAPKKAKLSSSIVMKKPAAASISRSYVHPNVLACIDGYPGYTATKGLLQRPIGE